MGADRSRQARSPAHRRPDLITIEDIETASARIAGAVRVTPVLEVGPEVWGTPDPVVAKLELFQYSGSFKARGATNLMATLPMAQRVVAASGGNFGLAVAWAAKASGRPASIFVPEVAAPAKQQALRALGCDLHVVPGVYADALQAAVAHRAEVDGAWAHAYDQPEVVAGAGTCGREFLLQSPDLDTVLVAVGGGGLIGGVATWLGPRGVRVIGVETTTTATMHTALEMGEPVDVDVSGRAADSLGARRAGHLGFAAAQKWVQEVVLVDDEAVREAQIRTWDQLRVLVEPGAAAVAAALMSGAWKAEPGERVGVILCGGNTDPATALT